MKKPTSIDSPMTWFCAWRGAILAALLWAGTAHATLLWDGNATNGFGVFKLLDLEDENKVAQGDPSTNGSTVTIVNDPIYGQVWQFYKAVNDLRCEAHGADGINPAIGSTYYIGWRTKLVLPTTANLNAIFQWKAYGEPMLQDFPMTIAPGGGNLNLNEFNPSDAGGQTFLWSTPLVTNVWNQHVLCISVSDQDYGGYIEYWYNGVQQTFNTGTNQFYCRTFDGTSVDPKWGAYGGDADAVYDQVDGLKIGTTYADVVDTLYCVSASPPVQITGLTGTNISYSINVATNAGFTGTIQLAVSGLPANTSYSLSATDFTNAGVATLSVTTSNTTPPGVYTVLLRGINGSQTNYYTVEVNVSKVPQTYVWNGPGAGQNDWSAGANWSPAGPPTAIDSADFFNAGAVSAVSNLDNVVDSSFSGTVNSLQYGNTNSNHTTSIAGGQTLNVGTLTVGTETDNGNLQSVFATVTGTGGALAIGTSYDLVVRQGTAGSGGSQRATLEMSGLGTFNATLGRVLAGVAGPVIRATGTLYLARTNTIYAFGATPQINVGDNPANGGGSDFLYLGQTNSINAYSITVGREKANGTLAFNSRFANSTANFLDSDGLSPVQSWAIADTSAIGSSSSSSTGLCDFSLGTVNALVNNMSIGLGQNATGAGASGTLTFVSGTININTLQIGVQSANGSASAGVGHVNVNGTNALLVVNSTLTLGATAGGGGTTNSYGTLNISGGEVLANAIAVGAGSVSNSIAIFNGTLVVTNTVGTAALGVTSVALTNSLLQFFVTNGQASLTATNLTTGGTSNVISIAALPSVSYPAQFQLIKYANSIGGAGYDFLLGSLPSAGTSYAGYLSNNLAAGSVDLVITNATAYVRSLVWQGGSSGNWDTLTADWETSAGPLTTYNQGDFVTFNDAATGSTGVNLTTALTPGGVTVSNNLQTYTFASAGTISGATGILKQGTNALVLGTSNNFTGAVVIQAGTLLVGNASALGSTGAGTFVTNSGTLDVGGFNLTAEPVTVSGWGVSSNGAIVNSGTAQTSALRQLTIAGNTAFGGTNRWDIRNTGGTASLSTLPAGSGFKITKVGTNQISLVAVTTIEPMLGDIDIQQGELAIQTTTAQLGYPTNTITIRSNAILEVWALSAGPLNKNIAMQGGSTFFNENGTTTNVGPVTLQGNDTFNISGTALKFTNQLSGSGNLLKTGGGSMYLSASNIFTGSATVNAGTLLLTGAGSIAMSTNISVAAGALLDASGRSDQTLTLAAGQTLGGFGTVTGMVTVASGSTIAPGTSASIGVLTLAGKATLSGTNTMKLNRTSSATNDVLSVGGTLALGGTLNVTLLGGTLAASDTFTLFKAVGGISGTFAATNLPALSSGLGWVTTNLANGVLKIITTVNTTPTNLTAVVSGNTLMLSWPADHTGWRLLVQTNSLGSGLNPASNAWSTVTGSTTVSTENITLNPANGTVFYRIVYP